MNKKCFLLFLIWIFLYSCTPTTTPTLEPLINGWSKFESPEFGFNFQYPAIYDKGFQSLEFTCDISFSESDNDLSVTVGDIQINAEYTDKSLDDYTKYYINDRLPVSYWKVNQTQNEIDGLRANKLMYFGERQSGTTSIVVKENKVVIVNHKEMNFFYCDLEKDGYSSFWVYQKILQSFKFNK